MGGSNTADLQRVHTTLDRNVLQKHLVPMFAASRLRDIQTLDIQLFLNQKALSYAPSVVYHIRATLSRIFATATDWGYLDSNPVTVVRMPHKRNVRPNITFEPPAVQRILQRLEEPYRSMVILAALTGTACFRALRIGVVGC